MSQEAVGVPLLGRLKSAKRYLSRRKELDLQVDL
jgi:hypothetical protein